MCFDQKKAAQLTASSTISCQHSSITSLSESALWQVMKKYYQNLGPDAWRKDIVPYQITSNKLLADLYANLISSSIYSDYLTRSMAADPLKSIKLAHYYVLELGAGHGKFSFYVCKYLESFMQRFNLADRLKIIYIASDISYKNIEFWRTHPMLQKYINNQLLDFALFDPETDQHIYLLNSKQHINYGSISNNLFVIANYVFDSLSHDAFKCDNQQLFATGIELKIGSSKGANKSVEVDDNRSDFSGNQATSPIIDSNFNDLSYTFDQTPIIDNNFNDLSYTFDHQPIDANYYHYEIFNKILLYYQEQLLEGSFLLPIGAFKAIANIKQFSAGSTIFLVADKGNIHIDDFDQIEDPNIALHGSVSFMVNFHALQKFVELLNGYSIINNQMANDLQIGCLVLNNGNGNGNSGALTSNNYFVDFIFKQVLHDVNPQHLINLCYPKQKTTRCASLDQIISLLTISKWDPDLFYDFSEQLIEFIEKSIDKKRLNREQERMLLQGLALVQENFFHLGTNQDVPFILGNIYYLLEEHAAALKSFQISIKNFGSTVETLYNIALCYYELHKIDEAILYLNKTLQVKANYLAAKTMLHELQQDLEVAE